MLQVDAARHAPVRGEPARCSRRPRRRLRILLPFVTDVDDPLPAAIAGAAEARLVAGVEVRRCPSRDGRGRPRR
jgi:hypothetical protein